MTRCGFLLAACVVLVVSPCLSDCLWNISSLRDLTLWNSSAEAMEPTELDLHGNAPSQYGSASVGVRIAPISEVHIQQDENSITCSSEGIYPEPKLTWSTSPPSTNTFKKPTTVLQTDQQLYTITSSLIRVHGVTGLTYSCTVGAGTNQKTTLLKETSISSEGSETTIPCADS